MKKPVSYTHLSNLPDNSRNESVQLNSNSLKMITSSWGAQEWCGTKDGFYYLNRADQMCIRDRCR